MTLEEKAKSLFARLRSIDLELRAQQPPHQLVVDAIDDTTAINVTGYINLRLTHSYKEIRGVMRPPLFPEHTMNSKKEAA
jgi:hypothetical protein